MLKYALLLCTHMKLAVKYKSASVMRNYTICKTIMIIPQKIVKHKLKGIWHYVRS